MKCIFSSTFHLRIDNSKMNVKYRENIIRINSKEIEMKSKNILELKEVNNMLHIEKINGKNVWKILKLHVSESQKEFVAANDVSIIEAYATITANGFAFPFGIYDNKTPVGFMMIGYDSADYWEDAPDIARGNYSLWRLMIDENYQKKGFGREAVALGLDFIKSFPCGKSEYCWLSYEPENEVARQLYRSYGFIETGDMVSGEIIAVLKL